MFRNSKLIGLCLAAFLVAAPAPASETEIDINAARALVFKYVAAGNLDQAVDLATLLIARDETDQAAWLALAQAEAGRGNEEASVAAAKRAWRHAETQEEKFSSSFVAARVLRQKGALTRAQLWLRRATQHAPNEFLKSRAIRDYRQIRAANPLTTHLNFSISPSSNINGGAKSERVHGGIISGAALALSGLEYRAGITLSYRLPSQGRRDSRLGFSLDTKSYTLSDDAKAISPASRNGDFAFQEYEFSYSTTFGAKDRRSATDVIAKIGGNRSGGDPLSRFAGVTVQHRRVAGDHASLTFGAGYERIDRQDNAVRSSDVTKLFGSWSRGFEGGRRLSFQIVAENATSASSAIDHGKVSLSTSYSLADGPWNTAIDFSLSLEARDYHRPLPLFGLRQDRSATLGVTVTLKDRDYYGFVPTIGLTASTTESTVDFYDTETVGLRLGLRSAF